MIKTLKHYEKKTVLNQLDKKIILGVNVNNPNNLLQSYQKVNPANYSHMINTNNNLVDMYSDINNSSKIDGGNQNKDESNLYEAKKSKQPSSMDKDKKQK